MLCCPYWCFVRSKRYPNLLGVRSSQFYVDPMCFCLWCNACLMDSWNVLFSNIKKRFDVTSKCYFTIVLFVNISIWFVNLYVLSCKKLTFLSEFVLIYMRHWWILLSRSPFLSRHIKGKTTSTKLLTLL